MLANMLVTALSALVLAPLVSGQHYLNLVSHNIYTISTQYLHNIYTISTLYLDVEMRISGGGIQHYRVGQAASLVCRVRGLTSPPLALYWERGNKVSRQ